MGKKQKIEIDIVFENPRYPHQGEIKNEKKRKWEQKNEEIKKKQMELEIEEKVRNNKIAEEEEIGWFDLYDVRNTKYPGVFKFERGNKNGTFILFQQNFGYLRMLMSGGVSSCRSRDDATLFRVCYGELMSIITDADKKIMCGKEGGFFGRSDGEKLRFTWTRL